MHQKSALLDDEVYIQKDMKIIHYFCLALTVISPMSMALPKVNNTFSVNESGFARVQVHNDTFEMLACYVAIDGHKVKFQLQPKSSTNWITATDKRFNYKNFSTWCDYLDVHPKYNAYRIY